MLRSILFSCALALVGVACSDDTSHPADGGHLDKTILPDAGEHDVYLDLVGRDFRGADSTADGIVADAAVDGPSTDSTVDGTSADSTVDGMAADSTVDGTSADSTVDSAAAGPCAQGATEEVLVADQVVACSLTAADVTQCTAATYCGAGWHLCTASEYKTRYGASGPSLSDNVWLAGCVREGGAPFAPLDRVCAACDGGQASNAPVSWWCNGITATTTEANVGLRTAPACANVGIDDASTNAYWVTASTDSPLAGALCCK